MKTGKFTVGGLVLVIALPVCFARDKRVNQIPNGTKFSCLNCHFGQGGTRNPFGQMIESGYLTVPGMNGNVVWGDALALPDADGDGFTNGTELQDPTGAWSIGNPNPGTSSLVANPGDSKSKPATAVDGKTTGLLPDRIGLDQNYPNPFNASTRIRIRIPYQDRIRFRIHDVNGAVVWKSERTVDSPGETEMNWDGTDFSRKPLVTGMYLLTIETSREFRSMRMLFLK